MPLLCKHILKTLVSIRRIHTSRRLNIDAKTVKEIRIPVPWGSIAGKRWGDNNIQPIIALHGLMDNSATFDRLIPLLETPSVLCLDLRGHGLSSHFPKGMSVYYMENVLQLRYILKYLYKWERNLVFLGHSFGSSLLFNYAAIFPEDVNKMINVDCARFWMTDSVKKYVKKIRNSSDSFLNADKNNVIEDGFTFDECVSYSMKTRESSRLPVSKVGCETLCSRGTSNMGNGKYFFTHDRRLRDHSFGRNTRSYNLALASKIKCEVLNIHATGSINNGEYGVEEEKHIKIMKENCKSCVHLVLEGSHHIHLESPEVVAPHINKFLNS